MSELSKQMDEHAQNYRFYVMWVDAPLAIKSEAAASLAKAYSGGPVTTIIELLDKGSKFGVWLSQGNTAYANFSRDFPTLPEELEKRLRSASDITNEFNESEVLRANGLVRLRLERAESLRSVADEINEQARQLESDLNAAQTELSQVDSDRGVGDALSAHFKDRWNNYFDFSDLAAWGRPVGKRAASWGLQPPGAGEANRLIQLAQPVGTNASNSWGESLKAGAGRWKEGWKTVLQKTSMTDTIKNFGKSFARGIAFTEVAELAATVEKVGVETAFSSSENEWGAFLRKEIEWYMIRRELVALDSLLDVLHAAYLHDLDQIVNELLDSEPYKRELKTIVSKPITDNDDITVRATLNEQGWLAEPLVTLYQRSPAYQGATPRRGAPPQEEWTWQVVEAEKAHTHIVFPISRDGETWNWTLDATPASPALRLDRETFQWSDTANQNRADASYPILFGTNIELSLREASNTVTIVH
jgi:hypothetical protein